jgi:hypothetical protein
MRIGEIPGHYALEPGDHPLIVEALELAGTFPESVAAMEANGHPDHEITSFTMALIRDAMILLAKKRREAKDLIEELDSLYPL